MVDVRGSVKLFGITISSAAGDDISRIVTEGGDGEKDEKKFQNTPSSEVEKHERNPSEPEMENAETKVLEEDEHKDMCDSQAEPPIKQDKILPCPRCDSLDTKFCYYNNYNFNQPRHFCKNCQRYWTAGGSMRNVPVGSGRRKNKNSLPTCRQTALSDSSLQLETPELEYFDFQNPFSSTKPLVYCTVSPFWLAPLSLESRLSSPLGKHSRESAILTSQNSEKHIKGNGTCVWIPNTLRIDHNPKEASMSSVWTTIGVNNQKAGGFHNAFGPKTNYNGRAIETIHRVSHANPAAMSRSIKFQENV